MKQKCCFIIYVYSNKDLDLQEELQVVLKKKR